MTKQELLSKVGTPLSGSEARDIARRLTGDGRYYAMKFIGVTDGQMIWVVEEVHPTFVNVGNGKRIMV